MQNLMHDIAVLQLAGRVQMSDKVTTVCLPQQDANLNSECYITGLSYFPYHRFEHWIFNKIAEVMKGGGGGVIIMAARS